MQITDTIADILTRIRNASSARHATVDVPASNVKKAITQILLDEGYIKGFQVIEDGKQGVVLHHTEVYRQPLSGHHLVCAGFPSRVCVFIPAVKICRRYARDWVLQSFLPLRAL